MHQNHRPQPPGPAAVLLISLWTLAAACDEVDEVPPALMEDAALALDAGQGSVKADAATAREDASDPVVVDAMDNARSDAETPAARDAALDAAPLPDGEAATPMQRDDAAPAANDAAGEPQDAMIDAARAGDAAAPHTVRVDSKAPWTASGFKVQVGACYTLQTKIDDRWLDADIQADLSGWVDKEDPRIALFAPLRRVTTNDIGFYQFAACVDKDLAQCFAVGTTTTACPKAAGELFFFVNDVPGFEGNNVGTATVTLQAQ